MLKQISHWLRRISTTGVALSGLAIFLLFSALVLPGQSASAGTYSESVGSPDTSLLYSRDDLYDMAEAYGAEGRAAYVRARFTFDVIWPLVYAFFLTTAISWVFGRAFAAHSRWQWANLAPLLAAVLDTLENVSASVVMLRYPDRTAVLDTLAPAFTLAKWVFVGGSFGLLLAGIVVGIGRWVGRRRQRSP
jgi:hypothetical protein